MSHNFTRLKAEIKEWGKTLCHFSDVKVTEAAPLSSALLHRWLALNCHGQMKYMAKDPHQRLNPKFLLNSVKSVVMVSLAYPLIIQQQPNYPKIATYALGRDYHKIMRTKLKKLIRMISDRVGSFQFRTFVDSAPILEKSFAERAGIGWVGKNTLLIQKKAGSFFVLGGFCTDLPLPPDIADPSHGCGTCDRCLQACPTGALSHAYHLNAKKCIAYLTMEYNGAIPVALRPKMDRYIFGCDECQRVCPWNQQSRCQTYADDFRPHAHWLTHDLLSLFSWTESEFLKRTEGSAIRRMGYECFLRNLAIAIGNARFAPQRQLNVLKKRLTNSSPLVLNHIHWAIRQIHHSQD